MTQICERLAGPRGAGDREGAGDLPGELRQAEGKSAEAGRRRKEAKNESPRLTPALHLYSYFTPTISNSFTPPGVRTSTTSPSDFPMSAFAIGESRRSCRA
jgi:hypothetical protein